MAGSKTLWLESSPDLVEAKSVLWALSKAKEFNWQVIGVESDCKLVVDALIGSKKRMWHVQTVIDNCIVFSSYFSSLLFLFCNRSYNSVAH